ncbi:stage VI sporulation protein D [Anoxybacteroides tepidamans]|uniref:stage VI sporulation protein D n=1 Tax=Anoxybacteroides tepidamans TaxID=265948 RepID=UPI000489CA66|nr:stage VI sporulation protein D [Anoxybacillus tepidamans]
MEQSYLRFSLEESIWFKKGQEVAEFLSISLDPVISVDEYEHYITIRGALELSGEYRMVDEEGDELDLHDFSTHRFIQQVTTREDGISELFHRFPVDITIPKSRIYNLEDVYVTIESFDYDLGEGGRLSLMADISISGIGEGAVNEEELGQEESWFEPFEAVARKEVYDKEVYERENEENVVENNQAEIMENIENETNRDDHENTDLHVDVEQLEEKEPVLENEAKVSIGAAKQREDDVAEEAEGHPKPRKENALYLTKLFSKEQGEDFSRVKICIVQQGDSMDKIAQRYDLSVQQILRANHLDYETELREGQLLYIPVPASNRP